MIPTVLFNLVLGGLTSVLVSIMTLASVWLNGSLVVGGNLFFDTTNNANPSIYVNSGAIVTYKSARFTLSGANVMKAYIANPSQYSSGSVLRQSYTQCNGTPGGTLTGTAAILPRQNSSFLTATKIMRIAAPMISSGSALNISTNSGAGFKVQSTGGVGFITASGAATKLSNLDCIAYAEFMQKYGR